MIESDYLKDNDEIIQKIKKIPTLDLFTDKDLRGIVKLSKIRKYNPGELIMTEGSYDNWIYFVVSGKVKIVKQDRELSVLKRRGDVFGEMGIIDGSARSASVYGVDEGTCLTADVSYIDRLSGNDKLAFCYILYRVFSQILANRLRYTTDELIRLKEEMTLIK
ncbi:MAG: cyclic nucleotide-binding domain-containing protein [Deltaproteobacteria bacterium]|nr:cyclic nucleotide-binding domain-containing protein [Deltaproteobacteria bacterium]